MDKLIDTLHLLCDAAIISGYEKTSDNIVVRLLEEVGVVPIVDTIGNVIFKKEGSGDKTLMVVAHYDEVGFTIKYIDDDGYAYLSPVGGVDASILPGQRVVVRHENNLFFGVIGVLPIHMKNLNRNSGNKSIEISDLWVDIGVCGEKDIREKIAIGDPVSYAPNFSEQGNGVVSSKSLDNRAGVAVLLSLFDRINDRKISDYKSIYFVASSQEELGLRGAQVAGYNINPDICIAIDATHATDYPSVNNRKFGDIRLGRGAVIPFGSNFDISLQHRLKEIADVYTLAYQLDSIPCNSGTDVAEIQILKGGCLSGLVSIPCRYMHTPTEIVSVDDIDSAVDILSNFICS